MSTSPCSWCRSSFSAARRAEGPGRGSCTGVIRIVEDGVDSLFEVSGDSQEVMIWGCTAYTSIYSRSRSSTGCTLVVARSHSMASILTLERPQIFLLDLLQMLVQLGNTEAAYQKLARNAEHAVDNSPRGFDVRGLSVTPSKPHNMSGKARPRHHHCTDFKRGYMNMLTQALR